MKTEKYSLILGSQSPRRSELFSYLGVPFKIIPPNIDEPNWKGEGPQAYCELLAKLKCDAIQSTSQCDVLVTADTIVEIDGIVLGKPSNLNDASDMLGRLSGRTHLVYTSFMVQWPNSKTYLHTEKSRVKLRRLDQETLKQYLSTGESLDKAGSYGIQGASLSFVESIEGSYSNIVGFPLDSLVEYMKSELGENWRDLFD